MSKNQRKKNVWEKNRLGVTLLKHIELCSFSYGRCYELCDCPLEWGPLNS
jgi:hypothetical protein